MNDYFNDFQASLFAFLYKKAKTWMSNGDISDYAMFKFDAHATLERMPDKDVFGIMELSIESDTNMQRGSCMVALSTLNDENIERLDKLTGDVYASLRPDTRIPLVSASTGNRYGNLVVMNGTSVMPILNTDTRPVRTVAISLGADSVPQP